MTKPDPNFIWSVADLLRGYDVVPEIEAVRRDSEKDEALVAKAKANTDADSYGNDSVAAAVLGKFIDRREKNAEIINYDLLKDQTQSMFAHLLPIQGFRDYLASDPQPRVDFTHQDGSVQFRGASAEYELVQEGERR